GRERRIGRVLGADLARRGGLRPSFRQIELGWFVIPEFQGALSTEGKAWMRRNGRGHRDRQVRSREGLRRRRDASRCTAGWLTVAARTLREPGGALGTSLRS